MNMEQTECSETSAYKIQTPGNCPEENIQHTEDGESSEIENPVQYLTIRCAGKLGAYGLWLNYTRVLIYC